MRKIHPGVVTVILVLVCGVLPVLGIWWVSGSRKPEPPPRYNVEFHEDFWIVQNKTDGTAVKLGPELLEATILWIEGRLARDGFVRLDPARLKALREKKGGESDGSK